MHEMGDMGREESQWWMALAGGGDGFGPVLKGGPGGGLAGGMKTYIRYWSERSERRQEEGRSLLALPVLLRVVLGRLLGRGSGAVPRLQGLPSQREQLRGVV